MLCSSAATLYKVFTKCGELTKCKIVRDVVTGFSKGYAFVEYRSDRDAIAAWREIHNEEIDGCTILVEYEAARVLKGWIPRRLGGGLGGKKSLDKLRFGGRDRPFRRPMPNKVKTNTNICEDRETTKLVVSHMRIPVILTVNGKANNARDNYTHRERERDRDRDGSREKRERDRESSRSSSHYRGREGDSGGKKHRERDSERSRDRGGERYKDRERYRDSEGSRSKERDMVIEIKEERTYEASDKRKDSSSFKYEPEEGEV
ncbi:small nuclear ribonucleoprotein 35kDa (U11 U12) [Desmophyllum pertusum]|uniref:Small nuclear ribonucleoprotein 35kDa (U11 U12) n=1 Tax=Desmophyllum pertusum TaxID=174260 RepID=A0A9X0D769_9CNID|nr:small nuclear ribonucleoprotein 35kDa (U11 U12) [Desmophyllum pertusum]